MDLERLLAEMPEEQTRALKYRAAEHMHAALASDADAEAAFWNALGLAVMHHRIATWRAEVGELERLAALEK
jgi:hypothetical protein